MFCPYTKKRTVKSISKSSLLKTHLEHNLIVLLLGFQQVYEGGQDPWATDVHGGRLVRRTGPDKDDNLQDEVVLAAVGHQPTLHPVDELELLEDAGKVQVGQRQIAYSRQNRFDPHKTGLIQTKPVLFTQKERQTCRKEKKGSKRGPSIYKDIKP